MCNEYGVEVAEEEKVYMDKSPLFLKAENKK